MQEGRGRSKCLEMEADQCEGHVRMKPLFAVMSVSIRLTGSRASFREDESFGIGGCKVYLSPRLF